MCYLNTHHPRIGLHKGIVKDLEVVLDAYVSYKSSHAVTTKATELQLHVSSCIECAGRGSCNFASGNHMNPQASPDEAPTVQNPTCTLIRYCKIRTRLRNPGPVTPKHQGPYQKP